MSCGAAAQGTGPPRSDTSGERRHVTVVFTDLVGSTELSSRVDAEVFSDVIQAFHRAAASVMERHGGHVVKLLGDGLLVAFGYPQAHEDDAERAVRAAWDLPRAIGELNQDLDAEHGVALAVRSGVHTGLVVVDSSEGDTPQLLGETLNVASRVQEEADPDTVVITDATLDLVPGIFVTHDIGMRDLRGIGEPVRLHEVVQPSGVRSRLDVAVRLTPLVGREQEVGLLQDRWAAVEEGEGQVVLIGAEPGMGKSRLLRVFRDRLTDVTHSWLECRCSAYAADTAFGAIAELVGQGLGFTATDTPDEQLAALERGLVLAGMDESTVPVIASVLDLPVEFDHTPPDQLHQRAVSALVRWTTTLAERQPMVVAVEDLHWADPSTLDVLAGLVDQVPVSKAMVVATHRPEFEVPWPPRAHLTHVTVGRLRQRQAAEMVAALPGGGDLPDPLVEQVVTRAGGIPLFVEELTKAVVEAGVDPGADIPPTLQDSLMARLDRLPRGKEVAQVGAAIGREFDEGLLADVAPIDEQSLQQGLDELVQAELLYRRGEPPEASYLFKHALVQDAAYGSLLRRSRRELHGRIAVALELRDAGPEILARHLEEAGRAEESAQRWAAAAGQSLSQGAGREAGSHARRGLRALEGVKDGPDRERLEFDLLDHAIRSTFETTGLGIGEEAGSEDEERFVELADRVGTTRQRAGARLWLGTRMSNTGELEGMRRVGEEVLDLAEGEPVMTHLGHGLVCMAVLFQGDYQAGVEHARLAAAVQVDGDEVRAEIGTDFGVWLPWWTSIANLYLARLDTALEAAEPALARAASAPLTFDRVSAWLVPLQARAFRGEYELAEELGRKAVEALGDDDAAIAAGFAHTFHGWVRAAAGDPDGAVEVEQGLATLGEYGSTTGLGAPFLIGLAAEAMLAAERPEDALALAALGMDVAEQSRQPGAIPSLERSRGEGLLRSARPSVEEAERAFRTALEVAQQQGALYEVLRAATSLARLLRDQGRRDEARTVLEPVLSAVVEGRDTPIVQASEELLATLRS